jgi:hypothetical protein
MALMGYREYARHRGCTLNAVQTAIKTGRILATEDKKIDAVDADARWAATTDPALQRKEPPPAPPAPVLSLLDGAMQDAPALRRPEWPEWPGWTPAPPKREEPEPAAPAGGIVVGMDTYLAAKTERERAEAEMAKDALLRARNKLIDADEARRVFAAIGRMFSQARENLPTQLATKLVGKTDLTEMEILIRGALREADAKVADEIQARFANVVSNHGGDNRGLAG